MKEKKLVVVLVSVGISGGCKPLNIKYYSRGQD
jgi:uncharacterized membrane protein